MATAYALVCQEKLAGTGLTLPTLFLGDESRGAKLSHLVLSFLERVLVDAIGPWNLVAAFPHDAAVIIWIGIALCIDQ